MNTIQFDRELRDKLRVAYQRAVLNKRETFMFQDQELLTASAKYLLAYLDKKFTHSVSRKE